MTPQLISVNVGRPREVRWEGQRVRTAIWKAPIEGRATVRRMNVDGDDQADRVGHGGEHRAVFVYQLDAYRHWERALDRNLEGPGQFGENLTVQGLADDDVAIGDRLRIGGALLEVTQPRVTCFKVGIRLAEPRMPALLTGSGRPGFYARVLDEGDIGAGDAIEHHAVGGGMTVREVSDLLYLPRRDADRLQRALALPALPGGWRASFRELLDAAERPGPAGPAWSGFRPFVVAEVADDTADVRSLLLEPLDGGALGEHAAGQFVAVRVARPDGQHAVRSYSISSPPGSTALRLSIKRDGAVSAQLHADARPGTRLDVAAPRGAFTLDAPGDAPVILASAGIGVTPVLAMLGELVRSGSRRRVTWLHAARSGAEHALAAEADALLQRLPGAERHVIYSRPRAEDAVGRAHDHRGRLSPEQLQAWLHVATGTEAYVCGPPAFMAAVRTGLLACGLAPDAIHAEAFGTVSPAAGRPPHPPAHEPATGFRVTFARSGLTVRQKPGTTSLLELAEACDVHVDWSCRTGVCHRCETGLVDGDVAYDPEPLDPAASGSVLLCCGRPAGDITVDA